MEVQTTITYKHISVRHIHLTYRHSKLIHCTQKPDTIPEGLQALTTSSWVGASWCACNSGPGGVHGSQ
jgi:hypothetical protein